MNHASGNSMFMGVTVQLAAESRTYHEQFMYDESYASHDFMRTPYKV